ncbi:MAG: hypothetical protein HFACDABA_01843 [Anaerolineales bacterium]|nr:hypothetical protein [Anaerolineales bacterium]
MEQNDLAPAPKTHSKIGIAAFVLGVIPLCVFAAYIVYFFVDINNRLILSQKVADTPLIYLSAAALCFLMGIADLILGVWALFQKGRRKALPIAGLVLTLVSFICWALAFITIFAYTGG